MKQVKKKILSFGKFFLLILVPVLIIVYKLGGDVVKKLRLINIRYAIESKITSQIESKLPIKLTPKIEWLATKDNKIVNEKGETMILRGVNIASINWGFETWNPKAVNWAIKNWHVNVIRTRIYPQDFKKDETNFFVKLESEIVYPARKKGVYVILHSFTPNSIDDLPDSAMIAMWQAIAKHYKDDPIILYDLIPEPHNTTKEKVQAAYLNLIPKVREANPKSLIFVTGLGWGREINSYLSSPLPFNNIVYRSNAYNRSAEFEGLFGKIAVKYPVFIGEFGADGYPAMSRESVSDLLNYADKLGLGWTGWIFHSQGCPCLLADWKTFKPSAYGEIVYNALQKQPNLAVLYEAEEQEQAGTVIYDDIFHHGFVEQGWGREIDLQSQEKVWQGKNSLKIEFKQGQAGLGLHTYDLVDAKNLSWLQFYINFGLANSFSITVNLDNASEQTIGEVNIEKYIVPEKDNWRLVKIPLADFGLKDELISGMAVRNASGVPQQAIFIDEIKIL